LGVLCATDHGEGRIKDGIVTSPVDHGGHLIGSQFGGPGEQINYVPMSETLNTSGPWYQMEMEWANYLSQQTGSPRIRNLFILIIYDGNSKKPKSFEVSWEEFDLVQNKFVEKEREIDNY